MNVLRTFALGAVIGGVFTALRFPIPAPSNPAGVSGVVGLFAGSVLVTAVVRSL